MNLECQLTPESQAYTQAADYVTSAAQLIHPFNNHAALLLIHQAKALLQIGEPTEQPECDSPISVELQMEVDALVRDIESMMKMDT